MDLTLPLQETGAISAGTGLWIALAIGIVFGAFLEQGGMGNARKIAAQFYLRDLSVLKIMFSAIVTAALGLFWFARLGWLDYELIFLEPTYLWPQAVGGLVFGAGFVVGGLCPGTSCVALASGRLDGLVLLLGLLGGIAVFSESFAWIEGFYRSGSLGPAALTELTGWPQGVLLALLVALALGAFALAEWLERRAR